MLHGMECFGSQSLLAVRLGHADIESRYNIARRGDIATAHINPAEQPQVVDLKLAIFPLMAGDNDDVKTREALCRQQPAKHTECRFRGKRPKVAILLEMVLDAGGVANHTYSKERHIPEMAHLGNRT